GGGQRDVGPPLPAAGGVPLRLTVAQQENPGHGRSLVARTVGIVKPMAVLRLFAAAREAAGTGRADIDGATVGEVLENARARFGSDLDAVLQRCRIWLNGEPADDDTPVRPSDEVAVLPPVSGG